MHLDRPVIVTGTPRSGKTLISSILARAPEFYYSSEPLSLWNTGLTASGDDRRSAEEATEGVVNTIRIACAQQTAAAGKRRYLDDFAYHTLRIPFLLKVMPEARVIHVVRSAEGAIPEMLFGWTQRDSVRRALKRRWRGLRLRTLPQLALRFLDNYVQARRTGRRRSWGPRVPLGAHAAENLTLVQQVALQWRVLIETAKEDLTGVSPGMTVMVRFEDLMNDPTRTVTRLATFCEVDAPERFGELAATVINPNHEFEKRIGLTDDEWSSIHELIAPLQQELGYW